MAYGSSNARHRPKGDYLVHRRLLATGQNTRINMGGGIGGAGLLKAISLDFSAGANASGVITVREGTSTGAVLFTITTGTDTTGASTGQMLTVCTDGLNVSNSTLSDIAGIPFKGGVYISYASATAGDTCVVRLLVDHSVRYVVRTLALVGSNGSATANTDVFTGKVGVLVGLRIAASAAATADCVIKVDADNKGSNAGATLFTATNFGTTPIGSAGATGLAAPLAVGGLDESGGAVTSPGGFGFPFMHGFNCNIAQGNSAETIKCEFWIGN
jgi:hypothetical protein